MQTATTASVALVLNSCGLQHPAQPKARLQTSDCALRPHLDELDGQSLLGESFRVSYVEQDGTQWANTVSIVPETLGFQVGNDRHTVRNIHIPHHATDSNITVSAETLLSMAAVKDIRREGDAILFIADSDSVLKISKQQFAKFCKTMDTGASGTATTTLSGEATLNGALRYLVGAQFSGTCCVETVRVHEVQQLALNK